MLFASSSPVDCVHLSETRGSWSMFIFSAHHVDRAFPAAWKQMPQRAAIDGPRDNDDKGWWRQLDDLVLAQVAPSLSDFDRDNFFEIAYVHFAVTGFWGLHPEVLEVLEK